MYTYTLQYQWYNINLNIYKELLKRNTPIFQLGISKIPFQFYLPQARYKPHSEEQWKALHEGGNNPCNGIHHQRNDEDVLSPINVA